MATAATDPPLRTPASSSDTDTDNEAQDPFQHQPPKKSWRVWLLDDVHVDYTDMPLMVCCLISGLCDSVTVNAANVFVSMQTGNTIFLALGAAGLPADQPSLWLRSLVSIACFALGCFSFSNTRHFGPKRKITLAGSFLVQALAIFLAAILAETDVIPDFNQSSVPGYFGGAVAESLASNKSNQLDLIPVGLIAWQFGGQISSSRMLGFGEVPTCVLTSVYCDLVSDPKILAPVRENAKRNRRFFAVALLLIGGIFGGWLQRSPAGMTVVLWIAGFLKVLLSAAWIVWPTKEAASEKAGAKA